MKELILGVNKEEVLGLAHRNGSAGAYALLIGTLGIELFSLLMEHCALFKIAEDRVLKLLISVSLELGLFSVFADSHF